MADPGMAGKAFIGADIGGTNTVIGLFDERGLLLGERRLATMRADPRRPTSEPAEFIDRLGLEIGALALAHGYRDIAAAGFGVPGWVDTATGMALDASNMGWRNVPFAEAMGRRLGAPVYIDNDVRLYTLGEAMAGAGEGCPDLVCVTVGTGLSAGIMMNGVLVRGEPSARRRDRARSRGRPGRAMQLRQAGLPGDDRLGAGHRAARRGGRAGRQAYDAG
ncbi:ROK family protein [Cohnella rhizosphaerae]|uniref:ROK family protein n=1 Tax=Cohnella rhizosphaerae TaxID=1457232 RepID=A0A9X4KT76_9BACL|nr:ROK family protein [Cohnella rhizosphaerae]MDG0810128.1 ROK family protein [Cohnella rhizosphaerae]